MQTGEMGFENEERGPDYILLEKQSWIHLTWCENLCSKQWSWRLPIWDSVSSNRSFLRDAAV